MPFFVNFFGDCNMKKIKNVIICISIILLFIFNNVEAANKEIVVGTNAVYAPLEMLDENGKPTGFNSDLITLILEKNGYVVVFKDMQFDGLIPSLTSGQIDIVGSTFSITEDRKKRVDYTDSTLTGGLAIAYNKTKLSSVKNVSDLEGKSLGCEVGTTGCEETNKVKNAKVTIYDDTIALMMALEGGKVDAVISDAIPNSYYVKTTKQTNVVALQDLLSTEQYAFAVKKNTNKDLVEKINTTLKQIKKNGEYKKIKDKWGIK
jgi:polar amino acid transport system substrate-binding protein